ncbi:MAG: hypothetical protein M3P11_13130 [Actinomycetota bacterium]|nr:hypothetical protein [Actinomycetota bacterium]
MNVYDVSWTTLGARSTLTADVRVLQPFPQGPIVVIDDREGRNGVWEIHFDERTHDIVASKGLERTERMSGRIALAELLTPEIADAVIRLLGGAVRFREI